MTDILIILGIGLFLLIIVIALTSRQTDSEWKTEVKNKLSQLSKKSSTNDIDQLINLVISVDKLLDHALKEKNIGGLSLGDRLKRSKKQFSRTTYNNIWEAHKVRNKLVHEINYNVSKATLRKSFSDLKKGIVELTK